jgi:hypothetical protein
VIPYKRLQDVVFWNMEIPPQQKFYIPEAYTPEVPCCDPVQNAPECGVLEYRNSSTAGILYSRSLYSRGLLAVILYKRLQDGVFWNIENPPQQKFYIPEAYIPNGSLL